LIFLVTYHDNKTRNNSKKHILNQNSLK